MEWTWLMDWRPMETLGKPAKGKSWRGLHSETRHLVVLSQATCKMLCHVSEHVGVDACDRTVTTFTGHNKLSGRGQTSFFADPKPTLPPPPPQPKPALPSCISTDP
jgi:hypothetical protein